jgi:hypothetical protein
MDINREPTPKQREMFSSNKKIMLIGTPMNAELSQVYENFVRSTASAVGIPTEVLTGSIKYNADEIDARWLEIATEVYEEHVRKFQEIYLQPRIDRIRIICNYAMLRCSRLMKPSKYRHLLRRKH